MPLRDFKSAGHPQSGQWVIANLNGYDARSYSGRILTGKQVGIVVEADHGLYELNGCHVVGKPKSPSMGGPIIAKYNWEIRDHTTWEVHIVDRQSGETIAAVMMSVSDITPITSLDQIPPGRRETMHPDFVPEA